MLGGEKGGRIFRGRFFRGMWKVEGGMRNVHSIEKEKEKARDRKK